LLRFQEAHTLLDAGSESYPLLLIGHASALTKSGRFEEAWPMVTEAVERFNALGNRNGAATALNALGELERLRGNLAAAGKSYEESRDILIAIGSGNSVIAGMNMALICIGQKKWGDARPLLEEGLVVLSQTGEHSHLGLLYVTLLPCVAAMSDWSAWDRYLSQALAILASSQSVDADIAHHARLGGENALEQGQSQRASKALQLALDQWTVLDEQEQIRQVTALMERLV